MAYKIFLDTNIIIDLLMERSHELDAINEIIILGGREIINLYISESVIANTFYILRKEKRIDPLSAFREMCKTMNVVPFSKDLLYYPLEKYKDTEDGLLYFLAYKSKIDYFITRNVKDFTFLFPSLPVMSPTNFLKEIYFNDLP
ncbi:MAG TPA: PIN domain-containing protein [Hanamia sp.]|nr:PIN domain-containing protein [Hanamia sp.]